MSKMAPDAAADEDRFYRSFEEKYRGSRELIKSRLRFYLPFIEPFRQSQACPKAVDLGCGRGEWLELLGESGFNAQGVDLNGGMLAACHERGLLAEQGDAIGYIKRLPDSSLAIVSGFHVAEHLPFADLLTLVGESSRVLKPGGLLILETPNPENLRVAGTTFYLDPTHQRPLPPDLLKFLAEYYGFARIKIVRLQESVDLCANAPITLMDVLSGSSADYAVIAQKAGAPDVLANGNKAFSADYGLDIESLAARYDEQLVRARRGAAELELRVAQRLEALDAWRREIALRQDELAAEERRGAAKLELRVRQRLQALDTELATRDAALQETLEAWQRDVAARDIAQQQQLTAIYRSTSWRLTAPVRLVRQTLDWLRVGTAAWVTLKPGSRPHRIGSKVVKALPQRFLAKHRGLRQLRSFAADSGSIDVSESVASSNGADHGTHSVSSDQASPLASNDIPNNLSTREFKFYVELGNARCKEN
jgi:SAM-dependent methyltransferase